MNIRATFLLCALLVASSPLPSHAAIIPYTDTFDGAGGSAPDATWSVGAGSPTHNGAGQLAFTDPAQIYRTIGAGSFAVDLSWNNLWLGDGTLNYESVYYETLDPVGAGSADDQRFCIKMQEQPDSSNIYLFCRAWITGEAYNPAYDSAFNMGALLNPAGSTYDLRVLYHDAAKTFDVYYSIDGGAMTKLLTRDTPPAWAASTASRTERIGIRSIGDAAADLDSYDMFDGVIWDGGGANLNWSTAANWTGDTVPGAGDAVLFDGAISADNNMLLNANFQIQGIKFQNAPTTNWYPLQDGAGTLTLQDDTDNAVFIEYDAGSSGNFVRLQDDIVFNDDLTVKTTGTSVGLVFTGSSLTGGANGVTFSADSGQNIWLLDTPTKWSGTTTLEKGNLIHNNYQGNNSAVIGGSGLDISMATAGDAQITWVLEPNSAYANDNDFALGTAGDSTFVITGGTTTVETLTLQGDFTGGAAGRNLNFHTANSDVIVLDTTADIDVDSKLQFLAGDGDVTLNGTITRAEGGFLIESGHDLDGTGTIDFLLATGTTTGPTNFGDLPIDLLGGLDISGMTADFTGSTVGAASYPLIAIDSGATLTGTFASEIALPAGYYLDYGATEVSLLKTVVIPEPSTLLIWSLGLIGLGWYGRRRRRDGVGGRRRVLDFERDR